MRPVYTLAAAPALFAALALLISTAQPATAQNLNYTLSGVTFSDTAVATGYFDFNPTSLAFGDYAITTTDGTAHGPEGVTYDPAAQGSFMPKFSAAVFGTSVGQFVFFSGDGPGDNVLTLQIDGQPTSPGTYTIAPGKMVTPDYGTGSGEHAPLDLGINGAYRAITDGQLVVTPAAVPEASPVVTLGALLSALCVMRPKCRPAS